MAREKSDFMKSRKLERLYADYNLDDVISDRAYNAVMGGVVAYGLIVNLFLCKAVPNIYSIMNPAIFLVIYFACVLGGTVISAKSSSPIVSFIGYNLVVVPSGLVISTVVQAYGGLESSVVTQAFKYTVFIAGIMIAASIIKPEWFETLGRYLFVGLIAIVIGSIISIFTGELTIVSLAGAVLFSLYIGYDFYRSQQYTKTLDNAVDCALDIYLDIINLFLKILRILGRKRD